MAGKKGRSGKLSGRDARDFNELIQKSYKYLLENFHKFDKDKRFYMAVELIKKAMPRDVVVSGDITHHLAEKLKEGRDRVTAASKRFKDVIPSKN